MNNLAGYKIQGLSESVAGTAYTYLMAGNGLWLAASNDHINATIPIADCSVRGLQLWNMFLALKHGRIPQAFWDLALSVFLAHPEEERYVGVRWNGKEYDLYYPDQEATGVHVEYQTGNNIVMEMHSHPGMKPFFSGTDNADEQGLKIYGVVGIGKAGHELTFNLRIGVYGYFYPVAWLEVFEGHLSGAVDMTALEMKEGAVNA